MKVGCYNGTKTTSEREGEKEHLAKEDFHALTICKVFVTFAWNVLFPCGLWYSFKYTFCLSSNQKKSKGQQIIRKSQNEKKNLFLLTFQSQPVSYPKYLLKIHSQKPHFELHHKGIFVNSTPTQKNNNKDFHILIV